VNIDKDGRFVGGDGESQVWSCHGSTVVVNEMSAAVGVLLPKLVLIRPRHSAELDPETEQSPRGLGNRESGTRQSGATRFGK
jgi:hypothetical protein